MLEMEVFEAVARLSGSARWNLFVGSLHTALPAAYVSDEAAAAMWGGDDWAIVAGQMAPMGLGRDVDGGMRVVPAAAMVEALVVAREQVGAVVATARRAQHRVHVVA